MKMYPTYLTGQNHPSRKRDAHAFLSWLLANRDRWQDTSALHFERESDNEYDPLAVSVWSAGPDGVPLGYLPRGCWAGAAIDEGAEIVAVVNNVRREGLFIKKYYVDLGLIKMGGKRKPKSPSTPSHASGHS